MRLWRAGGSPALGDEWHRPYRGQFTCLPYYTKMETYMNKKSRIRNLIVFFVLTTVPTCFAALAANLLWRLIFVDLQDKFVAPYWIYLTTCSIIPVFVFLQNLIFYKIYLCLHDANQPVKSIGLDFLLGFIPPYSIIFSWTMFWGTACHLNHLPSTSSGQLLSNIVNAYANGAPLLMCALIACVCIGMFFAFVMHALRVLLPDALVVLKSMRQGIQSGDSSVATGN